jgi:hypothetical protein
MVSKLESVFQAELVKELRSIFPKAFVIKQDANYIQGIPDLVIMWGTRWAMLECKESAKAPYRPNQELYLARAKEQSWSATIYPENKDDVIEELHHFMTRP